MAISPIGVSFRNNHNISFESRKENKNKNHDKFVSSPLKAVPLAVLLAMSPLNSVDAQNVIKEGLTENKVSVYNGKETRIYNYTQKVSPIDHITIPDVLEFTSRDGDDIPEGVRLKRTERFGTNVTIDGVNNKAVLQKDNNLNITSLMVEHVTDTRNGEVKKYDVYYAVGDNLTKSTYFDRENQSVILGKPKRGKLINSKIGISENLYNIIADTMGDKITYTESTDLRRY